MPVEQPQQPVGMVEDPPLLAVENLSKFFPIRRGVIPRVRGHVHAVDGVSFTLQRGETLGLVGESGSGKSTLGKTVLRLDRPTSGSIRLRGREIAGLSRRELLPIRREMQIVFQDPYSSLNPRRTAGSIVGEPLLVHGVAGERQERVAELFRKVGLRRSQMGNYPNEFSGGQRQRIGIARALALNPSLIVADEPVSALDVSVQAQVLNLFMDLQDELGLSYLFVAHDLAVVAQISHRVAVMYLGRIVELAPRPALFRQPLHPYTEALLQSVPVPIPGRRTGAAPALDGDIPSAVKRPPGCHFASRCVHAMPRCRTEQPKLREVAPGHFAACHLH